MIKYMIIGLYAAIMLGGCTAKLTEADIDFKPPVYVEQMPSREEEQSFVSTGSIFGQGENPLFSDHKAMHTNDIVTVVISETTTSSHQSAKSLAETDATSLGGGVMAGGGNNAAVNALANAATGVTNVGFQADSTNSYSGQGSYSRNANFSTTISARIIKIMQNGNYFISGRREIMVDDEKQVIQLSGVIRPYDIDQNNRINSAQMSEAKIMYMSQGDMERSTKQGWGTKMLQSAWPF